MRRKFTLVLFLFGTTVFGQEILFDIHHTTLEEYLKMEEKLNSERISTIFDFVSFTGEAPPIRFFREENVIPDMNSTYFFKASDSAMVSFIYEWDERRSYVKAGYRDRNKEEIQRGLREKFHAVKNYIIQQYGEPMAEEGDPGLGKEKQKAGLVKKLNWYPNDSTNIQLSTDFYYDKRLSSTSRFQRLILYVFNTGQWQEKSRLYTLISLSKEFMHLLDEKDIAGSRKYFSDSINGNLNDDQVERLINNFNIKPEFALFSASESKYEGKVFSLLRFEVDNDSLKSSGETITIIFDPENKIIGIRQAKEKMRNPGKKAKD